SDRHRREDDHPPPPGRCSRGRGNRDHAAWAPGRPSRSRLGRTLPSGLGRGRRDDGRRRGSAVLDRRALERCLSVGSVLLDTHVIHWWSAEPTRVSARAREALESAEELVVAAISWYELAWLARHERIAVTVPIRSWLQGLAAQLRTIGITPAIADTA